MATDSQVDHVGYLELKGDPEAWIKENTAHLARVRSLKLSSSLEDDVEEIGGGSIGEFTHLIRLEFHGFKSLKRVPNTVTRLHKLEYLVLVDCGIEELPEILGQLKSLTHLSLSGCNNIKFLPGSINELCKLRELILPINFSLQTLPYELNDSVIISVDNRHVRKAWNELKKEIGLSPVPFVEDVFDENKDFLHGFGIDSDYKFSLVGIFEETDLAKQISADPINSIHVEYITPEQGGNSQMYNIDPIDENRQPTSLTSPTCSFGVMNNQHASNDVQMGTMTLENEHGRTPNFQHNISSCDRNNAKRVADKGNGQKKKITKEQIIEVKDKNVTLDAAAEILKVSRSTLKRRLKIFGLKWPRSSKTEQNLVNAAISTPNTEDCNKMGAGQVMMSPNCVSLNSNPVSNLKLHTTTNTQKKRKRQSIDPAQQHLDGANQQTLSYRLKENESPSNFGVMVTYKDDTIRVEICLNNSIEQLKEEVSSRLDIEVNTFNLNYEKYEGGKK